MVRNHPFVAFALLWIAFRVLRVGQSGAARLRVLLLPLSLGVLAGYCAIVVWYACQATYFDRAEPTITAVSSVFGAGQPLYPALDAAERYVHIYGPVVFLAHAGAMAMFGQSILVSKLVGAVSILASLFVMWRILSRRTDTLAAVAISAVCVVVYLAFGDATFWTRPDPLLILCLVLGLSTTLARSRFRGTVLLAVSTGVAVNLKLSGFVYFIPVFVLFGSKWGFKHCTVVFAVALLIAMAPFAVSNVSARHYLAYVELAARNGITGGKLRENLEWALFLCAPAAALIGVERASLLLVNPVSRLLSSVLVSVAAICVIGAKPGGGAYHLLPFVPVIAYAVASAPAAAWERRIVPAVVAAFCVTTVLIAVPRQLTFIETVAARHLEWAVDDLERFADAHPAQTIEVGYAGISYVSDARPAMVFRTRRYLLDAPAVQEHRLAGLNLPAATIQTIRECRVGYWLVPTGPEPFAVPSAYWPAGPAEVFPVEFRRAFQESYRRTSATRYFDIWECRR